MSPFSELRMGVYHLSNDFFIIAPDYKAQLKGCTGGIATEKLKLEVTIWAIASLTKAGGDDALLEVDKMCIFNFVNNSGRTGYIFVAYLLADAFGESSLPLDSLLGQ